MPLRSRHPAYEQQRRAEDLSAIFGFRVEWDREETPLLEQLDRGTPADSPLRSVVDRLLAGDRCENVDNHNGRLISRAHAGQHEAENRHRFRHRLKGKALLPRSTGTEPETKPNHLHCTTAGRQLALFGADE